MSEKGDAEGRQASINMYFAATSALMGGISMGAVLGWSGPALTSIQEPDSVPQVLKSGNEIIHSWIAAIITIGALLGGFAAGFCAQKLGRRIALISYGVPFTLGWFLILMAENVAMIITGRFIIGFCAGLVSSTVPMYNNEISTLRTRGFLGAGFQLSVTIGILMAYCFGAIVSWNWLALILSVPGVLMSCMMIAMPETPIFLMMKYGRGVKAEDALRKIRSNANDFDAELIELEKQANAAKEAPPFSMQQFKLPHVRKPFMYALGLMLFQQISGINAVMFYANTIFKESGSSIDSDVASISLGSAQVVATLIGTFIMDLLGRKLLLVISGVGHAISLAVMGIYYIKSDGDSEAAKKFAEDFGWLPLACLIIFIIAFSIGWGPIPWFMISEMTPTFAIGWISSVATAFNWTMAFLISFTFNSLTNSLTKHGTFWLFAGFCVCSIVFALLVLPETKGKTAEEIQREFGASDRISASEAVPMNAPKSSAKSGIEMEKLSTKA